MSSVASKIATIVHCVERARAEHAQAGDSFGSNFTHQDAAILNILRACVPASRRLISPTCLSGHADSDCRAK